ncbi:MFS family permease [Catenulispora sp. MAP12-49]|uniref:MFS transporter n=1 Tax=unclassified Catenulispora TaxID=414885 RepID=UPI003515F157
MAVVRDKVMRTPVFWSMVGRFPLYLVSVAMVVVTASRGLSYLAAGLLLAGYSVGTAALAPFVARYVDRYGQPPVLLITGVIYPLALIGFVAAPAKAVAVQLVCTVVAGAAIPPISGCIRSLWRSASGDRERAGLAIEAVLGEINIIGGPLLFSLVLFFGSAGLALIIGGVMTGAGAIGFATSQAAREHGVTTGKRDPLGALRSGGLVRLLVVLLVAGIATGAYNVEVPAFVDQHGAAHDLGLVYALWGVGGIIGGLWYGSRTLRRPTELVFAGSLLAISAASALVLFAWDNWSLAAALVVLGMIEAPATAISYVLVSRTARADYVTEAFTWAITVTIGGAALGAQLGGLVLNLSGTRAAFLGVVVVMLVVSAIAFAVRGSFVEPVEQGAEEGAQEAAAAAV